MPGHPFPLAAAAAAAAAAGLPATSTAVKDNPFPFFRPPQNMMEQVTQTQQALLNMMRNAQQQQQHLQQQQKEHLKRAATSTSITPKKDDVLDLSSSSPSPKRARKSSGETDPSSTVSLCNLVSPCSHEAREVKSWTTEDVCKFVSSVEHCQPFVEHFREQGIDGSTLILLKEDHLVTTMKMRLGSILKFKAALAKKMGSCPICLHCVHCHNEMTNETTKEPTSPPNTSTTPIEESNSETNP